MSTGSGSAQSASATGQHTPLGAVLSTIGVTPRSNLRLGISGAAIVLSIAALIWLLSGNSPDMVPATSGPPRVSEGRAATLGIDGGAGSSDESPPSKTSQPAGRSSGSSAGSSGSAVKKPQAKPPVDNGKRIKIDPGV